MHVTLRKLKLHGAALGLFALLSAPPQAQTIQKCTQPDGSVLYQQDVCPPGTTVKTLALESGSSGSSGSLTLTANSNHQYSTTLTINGVTVTGQVDTGATYVTISAAMAERMHISATDIQTRTMLTANGVIGAANKKMPVIKVGKFELYNIEVAITANSPTLIGMSALSQLKFANENGNLILSKR